MKPVYQTICNSKNGNCLSAMVASLVEKPIDEVPNFVEREDWFEAMQEFMQKEGYTYDRYLINGNRAELDSATKENHEWFGETLPDYGHINGFYDATVLSSKFDGSCHAVVCDKNFNIVHDPNPEYKELKQYPKANEIGYNGIIGVALWIKTPSAVAAFNTKIEAPQNELTKN